MTRLPLALTHLAAICTACLLMPPCIAQTAGTTPQQGAPPVSTQAPAPIVRQRPKPASPDAAPASHPQLNPNAPAPLAVHRTPSPSTTGTASVAAPTPKPPALPRIITSLSTTTSSPVLVPAPPGPFNRAVIFLDAAHGGADSGSRISDAIAEKDVSLQLAFKLRSLLAARGFTVILSRDADAANAPTAPNANAAPEAALTLDARAGMGNRARPVACLLLHATGSGRGVHLYASELSPTNGELNAGPWLTAQAPWMTQSIKLEKQIGQALTRAQIPLVQNRASIRPVDSLTCPALVIELAPKTTDISTINDDSYQQRVANAIAAALVFWQNTAQPPSRLVAQPTTPAPAKTALSQTTGGAQP